MHYCVATVLMQVVAMVLVQLVAMVLVQRAMIVSIKVKKKPPLSRQYDSALHMWT